MRNRTIKDLEFDKILEMMKKYSLSEEGQERLVPEAVSFDEEVIEQRAKRIEEIETLLEESTEPLSHFVSLKSLFSSAEHSYASFDGVDIFLAGEFISSLKVLAAFLHREDLVYKELSELEKEIHSAIGSDGNVKDTHPLLYPLFRKAEEMKAKRYAYSQNFISEHQELTQNLNAAYRNERVVLPIKRESRGEVSGYVQGVSSSGNTLFIEPFELVEMNNQVVLAEEEILRMKKKILGDLSISIRENLAYLRKMTSFVADFDFHYSMSCFVKKTKSKRVRVGDDIVIIGARHPLLHDKAVPVSLSLDREKRAVVLSGANAGGKTVTMKTVALFVLLNGLMGYAPMEEGSSLPLFSSVYTDIGDGQSIEENFSTFSGHMANVSSIVKETDENSLILFDELGSGTDPDEGASLTIALLDYLKTRVRCVFITSHYSQVKMHAYADEMMLNASMEFDEESQTPTYRVISGLPGDSHAIEIAKRMGLDKEIIRAAREKLTGEASISRMINELNGKQRALDRKITALELERREFLRKEETLQKKEAELEKLRHEIKSGSADELQLYMRENRRKLEKLVMDISTGELTREKTLKVKAFIKGVEEKAASAKAEVEAEEERLRPKAKYTFKVGDEVLCGRGKNRGVILSPEGKGKWSVSIGALRMTLKEVDMEPAKEVKGATVSPFKVTAPKPKLTLDLRGYTLEEALKVIDEEIEGCLVHNLSSFSVIHGYGNGILSLGIHNHLKGIRDVKEFYFANPEDGGMGKTYVLLG